MSPRAAGRLERLGFPRVFDYGPGKVDWMAAGLPTERADESDRRAVDAAETDVPTCGPSTPVNDLPTGEVVVVDDEKIVLGRFARSEDDNVGDDVLVEDVMKPGPWTVRAHEPLEPLLEGMREHKVADVLVTTPEGRLLGLLRSSAPSS